MIRKTIVLGILVLLTGVINVYSQEPFFQLQDLENEWKEYEDVKGEKLTVIDFWATWCQPCVRSLPELIKISDEFKAEGVNLVGISIDGPRNQSKILPFVKSMGVNYSILRDVNSEVMMEMNVTSVPTLMIFDSKGEIVYSHEGFLPGDEVLIREEIRKNL